MPEHTYLLAGQASELESRSARLRILPPMAPVGVGVMDAGVFAACNDAWSRCTCSCRTSLTAQARRCAARPSYLHAERMSPFS